VSLEKGLFVFPAWHMQDGLGPAVPDDEYEEKETLLVL
jgi:hypothetical protein